MIGLVGNGNPFAEMAARLRRAGLKVHVYDVGTEAGMDVLQEFPEIPISIGETCIYWLDLSQDETPIAIAALGTMMQSGDVIVDMSVQAKDFIVLMAASLILRMVYYVHVTKAAPDGQSTLTFRGSDEAMVPILPVILALADPGITEWRIVYGESLPAKG